MRTPATRAQHGHAGFTLGSDLTETEWAVLEPSLPKAKKTGRPWAHSLRDIYEATFHILRAGSSWRVLPDCFPPRQTVYRRFLRLLDGRGMEGLNPILLISTGGAPVTIRLVSCTLPAGLCASLCSTLRQTRLCRHARRSTQPRRRRRAVTGELRDKVCHPACKPHLAPAPPPH
jgi:transposase